MSVYKRNSRWWFTKTIKGHRIRRPLPTARTKAEAEEGERHELLKLHKKQYGIEELEGSTRLSDYADKVYLPWSKENKRSRNDQYYIKAIKAFFGRKTFAEISPLLVEKFKIERRKNPTKYDHQGKPASVNRELSCLSRIFTMAMRDGLVSTNPCSQVHKLREENQRERYLTREEETRLLSKCVGEREHLRPIVLMAIHTGMRRGEILSLRWNQVDFERGSIYLIRTKSGKSREVPINQVVREELLRLKARNPSELVFPSDRKSSHRVEIKRAWREACTKAGIEDLHFHDLRHTAATRWAEAGVGPRTIAALLGHADLRMTARHTHATDQAKPNAGRSKRQRQSREIPVTIWSQ